MEENKSTRDTKQRISTKIILHQTRTVRVFTAAVTLNSIDYSARNETLQNTKTYDVTFQASPDSGFID